MAMAPDIRARAEELRAKVRSRIEELRGGASSSGHSPLLGKLELAKMAKGPLVTEIREKGVIATARARVEKVRGGGGLLGGSREKVAVESDTGAIKFQRGRIAIEG
jgi:hypothetical protein